MRKIISNLVKTAGILLAVVAMVAPTNVFAASVGLSCPGSYSGSSFSCSISASGFTVYGLSGSLTSSAGSLSLNPVGGVSNYGTPSGPQLVANSGKASGSVMATVTVSGLSGQNVTVTISGVTLSDGDASYPGGSASRTVSAPATTPPPTTPQTPTSPTAPANPNNNSSAQTTESKETAEPAEEAVDKPTEQKDKKEARVESGEAEKEGAFDWAAVFGSVGDFFKNNIWQIVAIVSLAGNAVLVFLFVRKDQDDSTSGSSH